MNAVEQGMQWVRDDIRNGIVPATVASFVELHDYVDANEYVDGLTLDATNEAIKCIDARIRNGELKGSK